MENLSGLVESAIQDAGSTTHIEIITTRAIMESVPPPPVHPHARRSYSRQRATLLLYIAGGEVSVSTQQWWKFSPLGPWRAGKLSCSGNICIGGEPPDPVRACVNSALNALRGERAPLPNASRQQQRRAEGKAGWQSRQGRGRLYGSRVPDASQPSFPAAAAAAAMPVPENDSPKRNEGAAPAPETNQATTPAHASALCGSSPKPAGPRRLPPSGAARRRGAADPHPAAVRRSPLHLVWLGARASRSHTGQKVLR